MLFVKEELMQKFIHNWCFNKKELLLLRTDFRVQLHLNYN